jgi:7-cyano-7-deazaguanine synthase
MTKTSFPAQRRCCILLSGGIDSGLLASMLRRDGHAAQALWVDYGQPAALAERTASQAVAAHYALDWQESAVRGVTVPPEGEVPGRNDLLVAVAQACVPKTSVAIGVHAGTPYLDCSDEWVRSWQALLDAQYSGVVVLLAPFVGLQKMQVMALARQYRVPLGLTHSCERGNDPCGSCSSCRDRAAAHVGA